MVTRNAILKCIVATVLLAIGINYSANPVNSVSSVVITGSATSAFAISAGQPSATPLVSAPGITDASFTPVAADTADGFTETVNLGTLSNGNGTPSVATVAFRQRGNGPCHVGWSVSNYVASTIRYNANTLVGGTTSELDFITISNSAVTRGANGSTTGFSYQFASGTTANTIFPSISTVTAATPQRFCRFTSSPSAGGSLNAADNWVQDTAIFSIPTGAVWRPTTGQPTGSFSVTFQFGLFPGP